VGAQLVEHADVDKIAFTGSTTTGKRIMAAAAERMKRLTLELGGKAPNVFFADVPVEQAVAASLSALLRNCGQTCIAGARIFVEQPMYDEFLERSAAAMRSIRVGPGCADETQLGPIVSQDQLDRVHGFVTEAADGGATVIDADVLDRPGYFMSPGLITGIANDEKVSQEEIFGPVGVVMPFSEEDEVVALANATRYGLAAGVWTRDGSRAMRLARDIRAGTVWVNTYGWNFTEAPMGGFKESGLGRENGEAMIDAYTEIKNVVVETDDTRSLDIFGVLGRDPENRPSALRR
jgi:acyl-CoA reductase-like NAD-dependent aldehyde dehydrogenase